MPLPLDDVCASRCLSGGKPATTSVTRFLRPLSHWERAGVRALEMVLLELLNKKLKLWIKRPITCATAGERNSSAAPRGEDGT